MKKFAESNFGILLLSIIPTIIAYITMIKTDTMSSFLSNNAPFVISIFALLTTGGILFFRKWLLNKIKGIEHIAHERTSNSDTMQNYMFRKHEEQFEIFAQTIDHYLRNKDLITSGFKVKKAKPTQAEEVLFGRLSNYEKERLKQLMEMLNRPFEEKPKD